MRLELAIMSPTSHEAMTSTSSENILRLNDPCSEENIKHQVADCVGKKKKDPRVVGGVLRLFSVIICKKVEAKGRTTYREVADEIIADFSSFGKNISPLTAFEEKNIQRRVYDAFNVLKAINLIANDNKEIRWIGFPKSRTDEINKLEERRHELAVRIQKKLNYLQELEEQYVDLHNLALRNQQMLKSGCYPHEGVALPFILVQTCSQATVEIEISEDMQLVHFDFNGTPFNLHEHFSVLREMRNPRTKKATHTCRSLSYGSVVIPNRAIRVPGLFSRGTLKHKINGLQKCIADGSS